MIDKNLIKHFKAIQEQELIAWRGKGINTKFTSRPGMGESSGPIVADVNDTSSAPNRKGSIDPARSTFAEEKKVYLKIEEKRFRTMLDTLLKYREWEEERLKIQLMQGTNETPS